MRVQNLWSAASETAAGSARRAELLRSGIAVGEAAAVHGACPREWHLLRSPIAGCYVGNYVALIPVI
jgi:hypothetical protein